MNGWGIAYIVLNLGAIAFVGWLVWKENRR